MTFEEANRLCADRGWGHTWLWIEPVYKTIWYVAAKDNGTSIVRTMLGSTPPDGGEIAEVTLRKLIGAPEL